MQHTIRYLNRSAFGHRSRRGSLAVLTLAGLALAHGVARAVPATTFSIANNAAPTDGVTTDAFDFSQGARIYASSSTQFNNDSVRDILGASRASNYTPGQTIFADDSGATRNLYFRTDSLITLSSYNLRANSDPETNNRDLQFVRLWGSADNITWTDFGSTTVANPYSGNPGVTGNSILIAGTVSGATPAQFYRLEIQNGTGSVSTGAKVVELDGFGAPTGSHPSRLVRDPVTFNAAANGPTNHVYDEDPGYVTDISSSGLMDPRPNRTAFGAYAGSNYAEPASLFFANATTKDNGNLIMGDGGETVHWLQWKTNTNLPAPLAGVRLGVSSGDRPVELLRISIDGTAVTLSNGSTIYDHNGGGTFDLMFQTPQSIAVGTTFKLELTSQGQGNNTGPRLTEVEALLLYPAILPKGMVVTIR